MNIHCPPNPTEKSNNNNKNKNYVYILFDQKAEVPVKII